MRKRYVVRLTDEQRVCLRELVKKGRAAAYQIKRANVLLAVDADGPAWTDARAAEAYHCRRTTVETLRKRFSEQGLAGALSRKKQESPPHPRKLDGEGEAVLIAQACSRPPEGKSRWTLKLLADRLVELEVVESISDQTVRRTLKKTKRGRIFGTCG